LREDAVWLRRVPERCDLLVFCAISDSSSAALGSATLLAALPKVLESLLGALTDALDALLCALPQALNTLLCSLTYALNALLSASADSGDSFARASPDILHRALGSLSGTLHNVASVAKQIVGSTTDVAEGLADALE
jgi:hypothetical protein